MCDVGSNGASKGKKEVGGQGRGNGAKAAPPSAFCPFLDQKPLGGPPPTPLVGGQVQELRVHEEEGGKGEGRGGVASDMENCRRPCS
eukprot:366092-Chlamydomonas_euryale.AAC.7